MNRKGTHFFLLRAKLALSKASKEEIKEKTRRVGYCLYGSVWGVYLRQEMEQRNGIV
jgi:hypothetical protein